MGTYIQYENWLKQKHPKTVASYLSYMRQIEKDLAGVDLGQIPSTSYLLKLKTELQGKPAFMSRGQSDKGNILAGFDKYIEFRKSRK